MTDKIGVPIDECFKSELERFLLRDFAAAKKLERDEQFLVDWEGLTYSVEINKLEDDADHVLFFFGVYPTFPGSAKRYRDATVWFGIDGRKEYRLQHNL